MLLLVKAWIDYYVEKKVNRKFNQLVEDAVRNRWEYVVKDFESKL